MTAHILGQLGDLHLSSAVFDHRDRTPALCGTIVQPDLERRLVRNPDGYHAVGLGPVGDAVVDEGKHLDAPDLVETVAVDIHVLAAFIGAGTVVAVQTDVGPVVDAAPSLAQRLHDALSAV